VNANSAKQGRCSVVQTKIFCTAYNTACKHFQEMPWMQSVTHHHKRRSCQTLLLM
jgi:hypothetical protein